MADTKTMNVKIQFTTKTKEEWLALTDPISRGVLCIEFSIEDVKQEDGSTKSVPRTKIKAGDGTNLYKDLPYAGGETTVESLKEVINTETITEILTEQVVTEILTETVLKEVLTENVLKEVVTETVVTEALKDVIGAEGGIASLDDNGKVPAEQLPSYVDDVREIDSIDTFDTSTAEKDVIYVDTSTNKVYRWGGTQFVEVSAGTVVNVDDELSDTSENPVQNKVINEALSTKIDENDDLILNCTV